MITQYSAVSSLAGRNDIATHANAHNVQSTSHALRHIDFDYTPRAAQQKDRNE